MGVIKHPTAHPALIAILSRYDRGALEDIAAAAIEIMDLMDGDPDLEPNGDELDGTSGEDDFIDHNASWQGHPGCPVSDPPEDDTEDRCMAGDDGCSPVWHHGVRHWGYDREAD